jgi:CheY-like chemotaxis protein
LAQEALQAALNGGDLVKSLLSFARRQPLQPVLISPNDVVRDMARMLERTLGTSIRLILDLDSAIHHIKVDRVQLEAALMNLTANARDAMPKGGTITLRTRNEKSQVVIEIEDTGDGIPDAIRAKIFEPFFTTKPQGKGTGLGLSMVFGFVHQSGGSISLKDTLQQGTCFFLSFPAAFIAPPVSSSESTPYHHGEGRLVLVVEDNPPLRQLACRQIAELGYETRQATSVAEALSSLAERPAYAVLTDILLAGSRNGIELARDVSRRWPETKLILTSGHADALHEPGAEDVLHTTQWIAKPYRKSDLNRVLMEG